MNLLEMKKEAADLLGMLQNNSISGLNTDHTDRITKNLNREVREIIDGRPPLAQSEWTLRIQPEIILQSTTDVYTVTGSKNIPVLTDTSALLNQRDLYRTVFDGTYKYRIIGISSGTYTINNGLAVATTTATGWTAYKDTYPLPITCGDIEKIEWEDGGTDIHLATSRREFTEILDPPYGESMPTSACVNFFSNRWADYKLSCTNITAANGSRELTTTSTDISKFEIGDVIQLDTTVTDNYVYTAIGIDTTNKKIYLDRAYGGAATSPTAYVNPNSYTEYITFHGFPTTDKTVKMYGWLKPVDMVADTDECILRDDLCPAIIIGALLRDEWYAWYINKKLEVYYNKAMKAITSRRKATGDIPPPRGWHNRDTLSSDYTYTGL